MAKTDLLKRNPIFYKKLEPKQQNTPIEHTVRLCTCCVDLAGLLYLKNNNYTENRSFLNLKQVFKWVCGASSLPEQGELSTNQSSRRRLQGNRGLGKAFRCLLYLIH